ncbi:MAG TPA: DMT family transporter [Kofleriaceae bacterium]|nr:DMT family transporter [Kofleriaceae bacterium]
MNPAARAQLQIHACVVLWGFTAILGKLISLPAWPLVWWRMTLVGGLLALTPRVWRGWRAMTPRLAIAYAGIGLVVAAHWLTFYGAIKLSNASVAATCMAFAPVFQAVLEPLVAGKRFDPRELLLALAVMPGVALVTGGVSPSYRLGIAVGALSGALAAAFSALNKRLVTRGDALAITGLEMLAGAALLTVATPCFGGGFVVPSGRDLALLAALAVGCTLVPFTLSLVALRHISAFASSLIVNLEPVYAIVLAIALLHEQRELSVGFYAGVAIIVGAVLAYPRLRRVDPIES